MAGVAIAEPTPFGEIATAVYATAIAAAAVTGYLLYKVARGDDYKRCRQRCKDIFANDPESLPGTGRNYDARLRRCFHVCREQYG